MENPIYRSKFIAAIEAAKAVESIRARVEEVIEEAHWEHRLAMADHVCGQSEEARTYYALLAAGLIATPVE